MKYRVSRVLLTIYLKSVYLPYAACFAFFGNGNQHFFLLVVELVHDRGKGTTFLLHDVAKHLIDVGLINKLIGIQIGKYIVEDVVNVVGMSFKLQTSFISFYLLLTPFIYKASGACES